MIRLEEYVWSEEKNDKEAIWAVAVKNRENDRKREKIKLLE